MGIADSAYSNSLSVVEPVSLSFQFSYIASRPCLRACSSKTPLPMHAQSFAFHRAQIEESKLQGHAVAKYKESARKTSISPI